MIITLNALLFGFTGGVVVVGLIWGVSRGCSRKDTKDCVEAKL